MKISNYNKAVLYLGLAGVIFSGYLSATKLLTSTCAFGESCPYFLGYPACYYGFGMFLVIFLVALLGRLRLIMTQTVAMVLSTVSALGVLFAGYLTFPEFQRLLAGVASPYALWLPTCAYGLVFYALIFALSLRYKSYI